MTESFQHLKPEKQARILNAGYLVFGKHGYSKASTADIAKAAGISKAMVFHYFESKKAFYFDLIREAAGKILETMQIQANSLSTDFFDRILYLSAIKIKVLKEHPHFFQFLLSVYAETAPEVSEELNEYQKNNMVTRNEMVIQHSDVVKFKEGISPELVLALITDCSIGVFSSRPYARYTPELLDELMNQVAEYLALLKNNLYQESYLM